MDLTPGTPSRIRALFSFRSMSPDERRPLRLRGRSPAQRRQVVMRILTESKTDPGFNPDADVSTMRLDTALTFRDAGTWRRKPARPSSLK